MKTLLPVLFLIIISVSVYGQNENPYSVFGYEAPVMLDKTQTVDKLFLINHDSTASVWMLAIEPSTRTITIFDRNNVALQYDTLTNYTMMRWLSPDPYGQFSSPYMGMGNTPHMSADPDGGWSWIMAGAGFAVGAGAALLTGNEDDWWKWGLVGGVAGGLSFNQDHLGATKFNGGFREYGGLRITFNSELYSGVGNLFKSNWMTVANVALQHVGQGTDAPNTPNTQNCVYCSEASFEQYKGGSRTRRDFNMNQNGTVMDVGTGTVGQWIKRWTTDFRSNINGSGTTPPNVRDVISNMKKGNVYSTVIREKSYPAGYEHNVLIRKVQKNTRTGKYRYNLMDPNGDRTLSQTYLNSVHRRHLILKP
jgi:hypothetical protein